MKTTKQQQIVKKLMAKGIKSCAIIQTPDYSGGHRQRLNFSKDENEDWYDGLGNFSYIEWEGTPQDLLMKEPRLNNHFEPFHEESRDEDYPWFEAPELEGVLNDV